MGSIADYYPIDFHCINRNILQNVILCVPLEKKLVI